MKAIKITLYLKCQDDVPVHVVKWMAMNLCEHAGHQFGCDYEPSFVRPAYDRPPLDEADGDPDVVTVTVATVPSAEHRQMMADRWAALRHPR